MFTIAKQRGISAGAHIFFNLKLFGDMFSGSTDCKGDAGEAKRF